MDMTRKVRDSGSAFRFSPQCTAVNILINFVKLDLAKNHSNYHSRKIYHFVNAIWPPTVYNSNPTLFSQPKLAVEASTHPVKAAPYISSLATYDFVIG
tara:strand:+ start:467 stop:760 length:294 start_codon:yes stop_codon:yes gene_type:complete